MIREAGRFRTFLFGALTVIAFALFPPIARGGPGGADSWNCSCDLCGKSFDCVSGNCWEGFWLDHDGHCGWVDAECTDGEDWQLFMCGSSCAETCQVW